MNGTRRAPAPRTRYLGDGQSMLVLVLSMVVTLIALWDLFLLTGIAR